MTTNPYPDSRQIVKSKPINGRVLVELRDGHVTLFPVTETDEETAELLDAILNHIAEAIRKSRK